MSSLNNEGPDLMESTASVTAVRRRTEAVFESSLDAMLAAMEDLSVTESSLTALSVTLSPEAMGRLKSLQPRFHELGIQLEAKAARCREAARDLSRLMASARESLEELRRLARTATLVSLNALVVSRTLTSDSGTIDGLAREMRAVLSGVGGLVADLAATMSAGGLGLEQVERETAALAALTRSEALPAIHSFTEMVVARSRDDRVARSASLVSKRFRALQDRVGQVVVHLQVGDSFRQRLEHVEDMLAMAGQPDPAIPRAVIRDLARAQTRAALDDLGHALRAAGRHLRALKLSATDIPRAGAIDALCGTGEGSLVPLLAGAARMERMMAEVSQTSERLLAASRGLMQTLAGAGRDAGEAAEFERRMTVLGLNAILLSSRLGPEGRAMEEVAQQQRDIARSIIDVMGRLRRNIEDVMTTSGKLDDAEDNLLVESLRHAGDGAREVTILAGRVRSHLSAMSGGRGPEEIVHIMGRSGEEIDEFLMSALALDRMMPASDVEPVIKDLDAEGEAFLQRIRAIYTMHAEREVHDAKFPNLAAAPATAAATLDEDDILFA
ncbi:hypothetical protein [Rubellimicrobium arenae]|uniref:hypothetical protein n=1 Tax=Rubellimicrobium arenae TaxID=2817372 RepID=UPI001B317237|nr:hypothetical protein [Rubellimicrobium arenae]